MILEVYSEIWLLEKLSEGGGGWVGWWVVFARIKDWQSQSIGTGYDWLWVLVCIIIITG